MRPSLRFDGSDAPETIGAAVRVVLERLGQVDVLVNDLVGTFPEYWTHESERLRNIVLSVSRLPRQLAGRPWSEHGELGTLVCVLLGCEHSRPPAASRLGNWRTSCRSRSAS